VFVVDVKWRITSGPELGSVEGRKRVYGGDG